MVLPEGKGMFGDESPQGFPAHQLIIIPIPDHIPRQVIAIRDQLLSNDIFHLKHSSVAIIKEFRIFSLERIKAV